MDDANVPVSTCTLRMQLQSKTDARVVVAFFAVPWLP